MTQDVPLAPDPGHKPVMLDEVLEWLAPRDGEIIVDGTFGGGGYSRAILGSSKCTLIGIDRDVDAIERARKNASYPCSVASAKWATSSVRRDMNMLTALCSTSVFPVSRLTRLRAVFPS